MRIRCQCWSCEQEGASGTHWVEESTTCPDCNAEMEVIDTVIGTHYENGTWFHDVVTGRHCEEWICKRTDSETKQVLSVRFIPMEKDRPVRTIRQQRKDRNTKNQRSIAHG